MPDFTREPSDFVDGLKEIEPPWPDGGALVIVLDDQGRVIHFNRESERISGMHAGAAHGTPLADLLAEDTRADFEQALATAGRSHEARVVKLALLDRDRERREVLVRWSRVGIGDEEGEDHLLVGIDLTGHTTSGLEHVDACERFLRAFNAVPTSIVISTLDEGRFVEVNDAFTHLHGYTREEVIGRTSLELGIWVDSERRADLAARLRAGERLRNIPVVVRTRDGRLRNCLAAGELVEMRGKQFLFSALLDVTDRIAAEDASRRIERLESIGQMAASIASEFNNSLTVVQGNAAVLLARDDLPNDAVTQIRAVMEATSSAARLTRELLLFSRRHPMRTIRISLPALMRRCEPVLARIVPEHVELHVEIPDDESFTTTADPEMVEQALVNLVAHARDSIADRGRVSVGVAEVRTRSDYLSRVPQARVGDYACIEVADTGRGISPENVGRIFDPFFPAAGNRHDASLSLAVVHGIVEQHDGWIEAESQIGRGTTIRMFLPRTRDRAMSSVPSVPQTRDRGARDHIIVADDRDAVRTVIGVGLQHGGYVPLLAGSSDEALDLWRRHHERVGLLVTDVSLQGSISGRDLADHLRGARADLKVVFTSGFGPALAAPQIREDPSVRFLAKPFGFEQLRAVAAELLA
ncbi:hypothetical protein ASA1KI_26860 [Opitutales bacterium ASA1]|uniref:PAS domain S-box protein n=1 Tax=Congregicoccus parvus TaxID=3081749 RepID=UPI002B28261F|nr:hypothetical protein ASA1KI_26860 [Opitutales bacterium ASA1]